MSRKGRKPVERTRARDAKDEALGSLLGRHHQYLWREAHDAGMEMWLWA